MSSLTAKAYNLVFRLMPQDKPGQPHDYALERIFNDRNPHRPPKGVQVRRVWLGGHDAEKIEKPGNTKGWVLYIHGGGFTTGSARERRNEKLKSEGHLTEIDIQHNCCHAFQVFPSMPEARKAIQNAFVFVEGFKP